MREVHCHQKVVWRNKDISAVPLTRLHFSPLFAQQTYLKSGSLTLVSIPFSFFGWPWMRLYCTCFQQLKQHCFELNLLAQNMRQKCEWKKGVPFVSPGLFTTVPCCLSVPSGLKDSPSLSDLTDRLQWFSHCWGVFQTCGPPDTVLLQEAAKCSLSSSSRGRANPGGPGISGALLRHVNHWSGFAGRQLLLLFLERAVKASELGRESVLSWPEH